MRVCVRCVQLARRRVACALERIGCIKKDNKKKCVPQCVYARVCLLCTACTAQIGLRAEGNSVSGGLGKRVSVSQHVCVCVCCVQLAQRRVACALKSIGCLKNLAKVYMYLTTCVCVFCVQLARRRVACALEAVTCLEGLAREAGPHLRELGQNVASSDVHMARGASAVPTSTAAANNVKESSPTSSSSSSAAAAAAAAASSSAAAADSAQLPAAAPSSGGMDSKEGVGLKGRGGGSQETGLASEGVLAGRVVFEPFRVALQGIWEGALLTELVGPALASTPMPDQVCIARLGR